MSISFDAGALAARLHAAGGEAGTFPFNAGGVKHALGCFITLLRQAMYPEIFAHTPSGETPDVPACLTSARAVLLDLCRIAVAESPDAPAPEEAVDAFFAGLPEVVALLSEDVRAAYEGDPAARSTREVMCAYPSFEALSLFRPAHLLYTLGVPLIPRMMTEYAHRITGIDIHPGATVGRRFFIDHGTGVVIGETSVIGDDVKLYQGVTLGARSFPTDERGLPVKGIKRHPHIGNGVIVYAGATILGGDTYVGDGAVIGGNVWLTHSVEAGATVTDKGARPEGERR